jgi:hypothetical protein
LIEVIVASAFAGIVTSESSSHSHDLKRRPPSFMRSTPSAIARKPIETAETSRYLIDCTASSTRSFKVPASATLGRCARNGMPLLVGLANSTRPTGRVDSCCQSSGIGVLNFAPIGSTTSPMRSAVGVEATPSMTHSFAVS